MDFFERSRPEAGTQRLGLRLDEMEVGFRGLRRKLADALSRRYGPFSVPDVEAEDALRVRLALEDREYFIDPPEKPELNPVLIECDGDRVRYLGYRVAGWFDTCGGRGDLLLARGDYEPDERAVENYVRAAVAWQAASRGGMLVHGAGAVWKGRGFLFFGPSGAGKSTLAACNRRARIVSDDLSLLLPGRDGSLDLVGSPFRGTYEGGAPVTGRYPLAAGFRLVKARHAEVRDVGRARAFGELVGNLPFVAEAFRERPDLFEQVERVLAPVPLAHLHFRRDETYWDAVERAGL